MIGQKSIPHPVSSAPRTSWRQQRRAVLVTVTMYGRVVDSFELSQPGTLRAALRPVYAHLPSSGSVQLNAVEETWLPLGLGRTRREVPLPGLAEALDFVAA